MFFRQFIDRAKSFLLGYGEIQENDVMELETLLLSTDLGPTLTEQLIKELTEGVQEKRFPSWEVLRTHIKGLLGATLRFEPTAFDPARRNIYLMVGVNGVGKTTTLAKLGHVLQKERKARPVFVAADTFRAGAIEQLAKWGERLHIPVVKQQEGADPAAVVFDALQSAKQKDYNLVLVDTAGRLHTKVPLMEELKKINRIIQRFDETAPHEILLVLDATVGQNGLLQARQFHEATRLTGVVLSKLDGSAKGGIVFSIQRELGVPIKWVGTGEKPEDLKMFDRETFLDWILS